MTDFEQRLKDTLSNAYDIERELGGGGMSKVFVATDRSLGRKVVIKLLSPELTADVNRGRFRREIQVAAQLQHPHIVPLLSAGEHEELLYFTMPFITGESLRSAVEKNGPLSIADTVRVLYHVGEALDYAHGMGVVHRDIKPANILRSGNYSLVTDFGVAKALNAAMPSSAMTQTGMAIGTPAYMAPEQLAGDAAADHRIDIYALGLLAYELLNGRSPFAATTPQRILAAVLTQTPPPLIDVRPDVPQSLSDIVMSCLSKEPDDRPANAKAVLASLDSFSTASGEIRTMEHRIARVERRTATPTTPTATPTTRTATPITPTRAQPPVPIGELTPPDEVDAVEAEQSSGEVAASDPGVEYDRPKKGRGKLLLGVVALLVPIVAGALYMSQRASSSTSNVIAPPPPVAVAESVQVAPPVPGVAESAQVVLPPAVKPDSVAVVVPKVDPKAKAIADSIKKAARDAAAKKTAAKTDSLRKAQETPLLRARRAASELLANAAARASFARGATHKGGLLGAKNKGDLQTQIDALNPFLANANLTYDQFKGIVQASGVKLFDEFGRMVADSLQRFAR